MRIVRAELLMNLNNFRALFVTFLFGALFCPASFAQSSMQNRVHNFEDRKIPEGPGFMMGPMSMEDWLRRVNLTEEQSARIKELQEGFFKDTLAWRNDLVGKRFELRDMFRNSQVEQNQILAKQREISELESKIQERALLHQLEVRKVLTPEQIKLLPPSFGYGGFRGPQMMRGRFRGMDNP
jgi:Spy/CpxP family protein refolding chaperone